jgi:hypothetical protein
MHTVRWAALATGLAWAVPAAATPVAATFNFDADTQGTATSFSDTVNGLTATFAGSSDPGAFVVAHHAFWASLSGNDLETAGVHSNAVLAIRLSAPVQTLSLDFALLSAGFLNWTLLSGGTGGAVVASGSTPAMPVVGHLYPEGLLSYSDLRFDTVVLTGLDTAAFAIDNVSVDASEPASLALLGGGLAGLGWLRRRAGDRAAITT